MKYQTTDIWDAYERGLETLSAAGLYRRVDECHRFVNGDQWQGLVSGDERPAQMNVLRPIMKNATSLVGQNLMSIHYAPQNTGAGREAFVELCERLNRYAARTWERMKLDRYQWDILEDAFIAGDAFVYFYDQDGEIAMELLDAADVMLGDEQNPLLQEQPYILIVQRRYVRDVRREARAAGLDEEEVLKIVSDEEDLRAGQERRALEPKKGAGAQKGRPRDGAGSDKGGAGVGSNGSRKGSLGAQGRTSGTGAAGSKHGAIGARDGVRDAHNGAAGSKGGAQAASDWDLDVGEAEKVTSVLKLYKEDGAVKFARATRAVVYAPEQVIEGLTLYPMAQYSWRPVRGSARGVGDIWDKIPNQLSINKNLYRFETAVKGSAFPHKVYKRGALSDEDVRKLSYPDSNISVSDNAGQGIGNLIGYLQPANISPYAKSIWQDILLLTRELSGAGDNLENVDPTQASGAAINAAREAKALTVNMQLAAFKQFIEDIAAVWYDMWVAYHPEGLPVPVEDDRGNVWIELLPSALLHELLVDIRIDVSPATPYSKLSRELSLKELWQAGAITFEEYVEALEEDSAVPKGKLQDILRARMEKAAREAAVAEKLGALAAQAQTMQARLQQEASRAAE